MRCLTDHDVHAVADNALPWLLEEPVRHNALCTAILSRLSEPEPEPGAIWVRVLDDDSHLVAVAMHSPPRALLLSTMGAPAAQILADYLAHGAAGDPARRLPGVDGPADAALAFVQRYGERSGAQALPGLSSRMYVLDRVAPPHGVPGRLREAAADDRDMIVRWVSEFSAEALPHQQPSDPGPGIDRRLRRGGMLWLWEDAGVPVSLLWLSVPAAGVVRISVVYTPAALRGNGYASACVAAASQRVLDEGVTACMLYADTANPTSNAIYSRIGFQPVEDSQEWLFSYP
jgi:GNAT superfamily N-acetyltransferase